MPAQPPSYPGCPAARRAGPLPGPAAVRLCLIPDSAPPFDGERSPAGTFGSEPSPAVTEGASGPGAKASPAPPGAAAPGTGGGPPGPGRPPGWPGRFAQVLAETLAGARPARQIAPWTTEQARRHIQRLGPRLLSQQQPRVRRVITSCPAPGVLEMSVVVGFGPRVRALAVRLERERPAAPAGLADAPPRWLCTAVEAA